VQYRKHAARVSNQQATFRRQMSGWVLSGLTNTRPRSGLLNTAHQSPSRIETFDSSRKAPDRYAGCKKPVDVFSEVYNPSGRMGLIQSQYLQDLSDA